MQLYYYAYPDFLDILLDIWKSVLINTDINSIINDFFFFYIIFINEYKESCTDN